jgi:iron-sulfur cluster assembly protein
VSLVLTITPAAEEALGAVVSADGVPDDCGVRISRGLGADGQPALGLTVTQEPEAGDEVVEETTVPIYVAQDVAGMLDEMVLDAQIDGDRVAFELGRPA